jgi:hypothetical protein
MAGQYQLLTSAMGGHAAARHDGQSAQTVGSASRVVIV